MINLRSTSFLLAIPVGLMGLVQMLFAVLSWLIFDDHKEAPFLIPASIMLFVSLICFLVIRNPGQLKIGPRDALIFATSTWLVLGFLGAIPIMWVTNVTFTDAVFESVSGLTTTGATILTGLDNLPKSFLLYRQFLQWMGGLGVVIFVVAVLPMLNVGGMKLLKAETPGPVKDDKITPRVASTAHFLWMVYLIITLACILCYYLAGMSFYDAVAHSFSTVTTGGLSPYDANIAQFNSLPIMLVADVFMLLGAISFALHFKVFQHKTFALYWKDEETRVLFYVIIALSLWLTLQLWWSGFYDNPWTALNQSSFHLISYLTSTGYTSGAYTDWPLSCGLLLIIAGYIGSCSGSTAGGNKIVRNILAVKLIALELKRLVHPRGTFILRYQGLPVTTPILSSTIAFLTLAAFSSLVVSLFLCAAGMDFYSALSAAGACLNNGGLGLGQVGTNFQPVSDAGTWVLSFAMLLGRLEYFTVIILFIPAFWSR